MIVGVGLDLAEVPRIARLLQRWGERFEDKVFTAHERRYARGSARAAEHFAARFAAKEATLKALGVPARAAWHEMEVVRQAGSAPALVLRGRVRAAADALAVTRLHLTLTHTAGIAAAVVIAER